MTEIVDLPFSDIGGGVAPGPLRFNRKSWDNPVKYKLNRAYGDEFAYPNFTQLSRRWKLHTAVAADFMFPGGSAISWLPSAAGSALYIPLPAGDFEAVLEYQRHRSALEQGDMFGMALLDENGTGVGYTTDYDSTSGGTSYGWQIQTWTYFGTGSSHLAPAAAAAPAGGTHLWTCIRKTGTLVQGRESGDGVTLNALNAGDTLGVTPVWLVIGRFFASGTEWVTLNRLNVYSAPTFFPG